MDVFDWARAVFALLATLALIGAAAYGARRLGMLRPGGAPARRLKVTESLMLDPRRRLLLVRFEDREHLLLLSPAGDVLLANVAAKPEEASPT